MIELLCPICGKNVQSVNVTPDCQHTSREIFEYAYTLQVKLAEETRNFWDSQEEITAMQAKLDDAVKDLKQVGDYADEAVEDASKFLNERDDLRKQLDIAIEYIKDDLYTDKRYEAEEVLRKLEE